MNEESCSAKSARILLQNDPKYQLRRNTNKIRNEKINDIDSLNISANSDDIDYFADQQTSPAYSYLNYNIFHNLHHN